MFPCFLQQENILGLLYSCSAPDLQSTLLQGALLPFNVDQYLGGSTLFWEIPLPFQLLGAAGIDWGRLLPVISFGKLVYRSWG